MKVQAGLDNIQYFEKPRDGRMFNVIKKRASGNWGEIEVSELAEKAGREGHALLPGHLVGGTKSDNCTAMQLIALDFDSGITYEEIKSRCDKWDLDISFAYETLSSTSQLQRFRVVFVHETVITDLYIIKILLQMFHKMFPECDPMCKNPDRIFLGGKKLLYKNSDARVALVQILPFFYSSLDIKNNYRRNLRIFCNKNNIYMDNGMAAMNCGEYLPTMLENDDIRSSTNLHLIGEPQNPSFFILETKKNLHLSNTCQNNQLEDNENNSYYNNYCESSFEREDNYNSRDGVLNDNNSNNMSISSNKRETNNKQGKENRRRESFGIIDINLREVNNCSSCRLLNDFFSGKELDHNQRFAIYTNLLYVKSGQAVFREILVQYYGEETVDKWERDYHYMKGYRPMLCSERFCPYCKAGLCVNLGTIVRTLKNDRRVKLADRHYATLEEAAAVLKYNILKAIKARDKGLHLIKGQTAIGKTEIYTDIAANDREHKYIIALSTNRLKKEVHTRFKWKGVSSEDIYMTPSIRDDCSLVDDDIRERYMRLEDRGLFKEAKELLKDYSQELKKEKMPRFAKIQQVEELLALPDDIMKKRIILTTHSRLIHMPDEVIQGRICIIDEDILQLQLLNNTHSLSFEAVKQLEKSRLPGYSSLASEILNAPENVYIRNSGGAECAPLTEEQIIENGLEWDEDDDINDLTKMETYVKIKQDGEHLTVKYFCPHKLPYTKIIIMSATINREIYAAYFKDRRIVFHNECNAKYKGSIIQYTYCSLGRHDMESKREKVFAYAKKLLNEDEPIIITFQRYEREVHAEMHRIHFGNAAGIDKLKGRNIAVIGTPFRIEFAYKLAACYLGADVNTREDARPRMRRITHDGNEFLMTTYADQLLREVQLYDIQSELEQCVGRARALRNDCTVYVFSSFPCEQAEIRSGNYLLEDMDGQDLEGE